jgi:hypothetical protein
MDVNQTQKDKILFRAEKLLHYNELLIKQCDSWLSAEEGNRNMLKQIEERNARMTGKVRNPRKLVLSEVEVSVYFDCAQQPSSALSAFCKRVITFFKKR